MDPNPFSFLGGSEALRITMKVSQVGLLAINFIHLDFLQTFPSYPISSPLNIRVYHSQLLS